MNALSHLPNAAHIDRVLESSKSHPEVWDAAYDAAWDVLRPTWSAAWDARPIVLARLKLAAALAAAQDAAWEAARDAAWNAARSAILALIAYDDAAKYLDMPSDKLRVWAVLSEDPAAVLLLPAVVAYERISELETV